ncbi:vWA domain-containing protein, partial [Aliarcobacter butzleri]
IYEGNETVIATISNATTTTTAGTESLVITTNTATGTIVDDTSFTEIEINEDENYIIKLEDLGNFSEDISKIKINETPKNGDLFLNGIKVVVGTEINIEDISNNLLTFRPIENTDADSSFKFSVSNGNGVFSNSYETKVNVIAVADAPTVSIDITKIGATTISTGNTNGGNSGTSSSFDKLIKQTATGKDGDLGQDIQQSNSNQNIEKDYKNVNANNITTGLGNDTLKFQALNNKTITTGEGNDKVIIDNGSMNNTINVGNGNNEISITHSLNQGSITAGSGNDTLFVGNAADGSTINMGAGNDKVQIDGDFKSKVYLGAGDDKIALYSPHTNFEADGRSYIDGGNGFDTLYVENLNSSDFKVKIKSTGEEITWEKYSELNNHKDGEANIEFVIHHKTNTNNQGFVVKNIEQIVFKDKTFGEKDNSIKAVAYKVDISAALTDTDGSETLSVVIKNVPTGAVLESTKYDVSKNSDGSWSVNFKEGTTGDALLKIEDSLTMKVPESYKGEIDLKIEATSTEARDNDGDNFATAEATSHIDAPIIKVDPNTSNTINGGSGDDILIGDTGGASKNIVPGKNYNIALVIDTSGSMKDASGTANKSRMDLTKDALENLVNQLKEHDGKVNVSLVDFNTNAKKAVSFSLDKTTDVDNLITAIKNLEANGGTNYEDAFIKTTDWFKSSSIKGNGYENLTYFLTDGDPTFSNRDTSRNNNGSTTEYYDMKDAVDKFKTLSGQSTVHAIGIGNGINENYLRFFDNTDIIGQGVSFGWFWKVSGNIGKPDIVNTAEDLKAALQGGSVSEDILDVGSDTINGGDGDDIIFGDSINTDNLLWNGRFVEGHENYMSKGEGIKALDKYLSLRKSGYEDMTTLEKNMAKYDYIKEHHNELNVDGDTRGGDDILSGGAGRDIIYGQGGNDTIITDINTNNGKADGDILIDGGAGFDTIKLEGNNDIDFSKLGDIIKNIEAIDLTEGDHKLTNISLEDVLKMSGDDNKIKITGDEFDSVTFKKNDGWELKTENIGKVEGDKTFDVYTNSGNSTVQVKVEQPISDGITN